MPSALLRYLKTHPVDPSELHHILVSYFKKGGGTADTFEYSRDDTVMLRIKFSEKGKIEDIVGTADLTKSDVEKLIGIIGEHLVKPGPKKTGRRYLFMDRPVTGFFRYDDLFQVQPVPKWAPHPPAGTVHQGCYPFIFEFRFEGSADHMVNTMRASATERPFIAVFNALIDLSVSRPTDDHREAWVSSLERSLPMPSRSDALQFSGHAQAVG